MGSTTAVFFPFDLFGSGGTANGARLLADAFAEMLADNRREKEPTRALAYQPHVKSRELAFDKIGDYHDWRQRGRQAAKQVWDKNHLLLWVTGNHLGALPVYDELSRWPAAQTTVVQFDAHLDIYHLSDCTSELSHGNWLRHVAPPLPRIINLGHRELLLRPDYVAQYFDRAFAAPDLALDLEPALKHIRQACRSAKQVVIDIDCDCLDPAFFPAVANPLPFGLSPQQLLRCLEAAWSPKAVAVTLSEFDPSRDRNDQSLATLVWLMEHLLLRRHESDA